MSPWSERLLHAALRGALEPALLQLRDEVESTHDEIRRLADAGAPSGTVVAAREQTRGRGRMGRSWHSPAGEGLYVSILHRTRRPASELTRWSLAAAAAAWEGCVEITGLPVRIKWPNDLLCRGRKLGGVLAESWGTPGEIAVAVGWGINVRQSRRSFPPPLRATATSLSIESGGHAPSPERLMASLLIRFQDLARDLEGGDWSAVRVRWEAGAGRVAGRRVEWSSGTGIVECMTDRGSLQLRGDDGGVHEAVMGESLRWLE